MKDTRNYIKIANELVNSNKQITLRFTLKNGNIIERIFTPTIHPTHIIYTDIKKVYSYDTKKKLKPEMKCVEKIKLPPIPLKNGVINTTLERLLMSGYIVYET